MKKIFISFAVLAVSAIVIVAVNANSKLDNLFESNVEALAAGEGAVVTLPCVQATSICYFMAKDANGNYYTASATGLRGV